MSIIEKLGITPGPWEIVKEESQYYPDQSRVESVRTKDFEHNNMMGDYRGCIIADFKEAHGERPHAFKESERNAQLIAAAPEMLEALSKIIIIQNDPRESLSNLNGAIRNAENMLIERLPEIKELL